MSGTEHTRPMRGGIKNFPNKPWPRWRALEKRESAQFRLAHRQSKANVDMYEQLADLDSERDWYTLNTVGVHRPWPGAMALWECELLRHDTPGCCRTGSDLYATSRTPGYDVEFDVYYLERSRTRVVIEPVIDNEPVNAWEQRRAEEAARKAARKERKRKEALEARKRTLTDEQRREILRRENVARRGYSRV